MVSNALIRKEERSTVNYQSSSIRFVRNKKRISRVKKNLIKIKMKINERENGQLKKINKTKIKSLKQ
jgi:hypothetical protein